MKKWTYVIGLIAFGFVIFNNFIQTMEAIKLNLDYIISLIIALIVSIFYGIINIKNK